MGLRISTLGYNAQKYKKLYLMQINLKVLYRPVTNRIKKSGQLTAAFYAV